MTDSRISQMQNRMALIKKRASSEELPEGDIFLLLKQMKEERGEVFNVRDYGFNPALRMTQEVFRMMKEDGAASKPKVILTSSS